MVGIYSTHKIPMDVQVPASKDANMDLIPIISIGIHMKLIFINIFYFSFFKFSRKKKASLNLNLNIFIFNEILNKIECRFVCTLLNYFILFYLNESSI